MIRATVYAKETLFVSTMFALLDYLIISLRFTSDTINVFAELMGHNQNT